MTMGQCSGRLKIGTKDSLKGWWLRSVPFGSCCLCSERLVLAMFFWLVAAYALEGWCSYL